MQALIDFEALGQIPNGKIKLVVSSNPNAYAIKRAEAAGIDSVCVCRKDIGCQDEFERQIISHLDKYDIDLIVLAGFMSILSEKFTKKYANRIINVHPSLIPSFCGKGFYGLRVHRAALDYGVKVTGATVHYVNEIPDGGEIILQKAVDVEAGDTPEILQKRVMEKAEWIILPQATQIVAKNIADKKQGAKK